MMHDGATTRRPPTVSMSAFVRDQVLVYTKRMLAVTSTGGVYNSADVHRTIAPPSPLDARKAATRVVHALKLHPAVVSTGAKGHWCCKAATPSRSTSPKLLENTTGDAQIIDHWVEQYKAQFLPAILDITGAGGYVSIDTVRAHVAAMAPTAPVDDVFTAILASLGQDVRLQLQSANGKAPTAFVAAESGTPAPTADPVVAIAKQLASLVEPQILASVEMDKPYSTAALRVMLTPMASSAIPLDALVSAVVNHVRCNQELQFLGDADGNGFFVKPAPATGPTMHHAPQNVLPLTQPSPTAPLVTPTSVMIAPVKTAVPPSTPSRMLSPKKLAIATEVYVQAMLRWLNTHAEACGHAVVYGWRLSLPFSLPKDALKTHIIPAMVADPRLAHRPSYLACFCFGSRGASAVATVESVVAQITPFFVLGMLSTTKKGKAYTEADVLGQLRVPNGVDENAVLDRLYEAMKAERDVSVRIMANGRPAFDAKPHALLKKPSTPMTVKAPKTSVPATPSMTPTPTRPRADSIVSSTSATSTVSPPPYESFQDAFLADSAPVAGNVDNYVAYYADENLKEVLDTVKTGNAFYASSMRSWLKHLPDDIDTEAVIAGLVVLLRQHPCLAYDDDDASRSFFYLVGTAPPQGSPMPLSPVSAIESDDDLGDVFSDSNASENASFRSRTSSADVDDVSIPLLELQATIDHAPVVVVTSTDHLRQAVGSHALFSTPTVTGSVAIDVHGVLPNLLIQLAFEDTIFIIECTSIPAADVTKYLQPILMSHTVTKIVYDGYTVAEALTTIAGTIPVGVLDLQLLMELETSQITASFADFAERCQCPPHPHPRYLSRPRLLTQIPLSSEARDAAAATVRLLSQAAFAC
ncbi:hypothetical protein ACHHYP_06671, partial [Achlya hypogyna]